MNNLFPKTAMSFYSSVSFQTWTICSQRQRCLSLKVCPLEHHKSEALTPAITRHGNSTESICLLLLDRHNLEWLFDGAKWLCKCNAMECCRLQFFVLNSLRFEVFLLCVYILRSVWCHTGIFLAVKIIVAMDG